jgi:HAMP domain-containing protein
MGFMPSEFREGIPSGQQKDVARRILTLQGKVVYESQELILEGQLGSIRLGIWAETVQREIYYGLLLLLGPITLVLIAAAAVALLLAGQLIGRFRRLMEVAKRMSMGDLDTPVKAESEDEFGELTISLERMRASLKAAMMRLDQN